MSTTSSPGEGAANQLVEGQSCLLNVLDDHFLVRILAVDDSVVRVSFPGRDYPVQGMRAYLEFHDEAGFDCYPTHVIEGPGTGGGFIVLERPTSGRRMLHRLSYRIPTDLTVQVKDRGHARHYDAALLNLSSGGILLQTSAPFDFSTAVEVMFSLPGEASYTAYGAIVHVAPADENHGGEPAQLFGIRFQDPDPAIVRSLNRYIAQRLRELYPN